MIRIGCAVWAYPGWIGDLFPPGTRSSEFLKLYSRQLTTVEGNTTFYATPSPATVARWAAETPASFRFCCKLPREVSHAGPLAEKLPQARAFVERMQGLGVRCGPFFLQLPPGYGPVRLADLERFVAGWPREAALAIEVRHPDWYLPVGEAPLMALLEQYQIGRVIMDVRPIRDPNDPGGALLDDARERKPDVPLRPLRGGGPTLVRYIGHPDLARNAPFLDEWAARIAAWATTDPNIYLFMHCPDEAQSPRLCRQIAARLYTLGAPVAVADDLPAQLGLF
ncbi:DUF72 domain-containing protein [Chloroflexus sp.]|uniref:DUF72 domain-containing protein n=1 Tax=Chloroflexus sp. TaxID=1904827 RepID=UPI00298EECDA|nr:DUF72 domain-containing protein [Chloroflexus sp.]MCS6887899.1 DUF72 domain-containing protein [Chloroflexus sp.]MDW8403262.1 DUF72 domain-containing protein [Chloroflexus sp.]